MLLKWGQYFMTKDTGDFTQFRAVACREYTLPRDDGSSQPRGWIQGKSRIGLVLEVTTSFQHFKYGIEIRIKSVNQDNLILESEFFMERSNMWSILLKTTQKILQIHKKSKYHKRASRWLQPDQRQKQNHKRETVELPSTIPINERKWFDIEPGNFSLCVREECESLHDRSERLDVVMGQSIDLSEIKTEALLENDDPAYQNSLLQQYEERIERLSK